MTITVPYQPPSNLNEQKRLIEIREMNKNENEMNKKKKKQKENNTHTVHTKCTQVNRECGPSTFDFDRQSVSAVEAWFVREIFVSIVFVVLLLLLWTSSSSSSPPPLLWFFFSCSIVTFIVVVCVYKYFLATKNFHRNLSEFSFPLSSLLRVYLFCRFWFSSFATGFERKTPKWFYACKRLH